MSKDLTTTERSVKVIKSAERKAIRKARRIIEDGVVQAAALTDDGVVLKEPTDVQLNVARDLRQSKRNAPAYLEFALRMTETADKIAAAQNQGAPVALNIGVVNIVQGAPPAYPAIEAEVKK